MIGDVRKVFEVISIEIVEVGRYLDHDALQRFLHELKDGHRIFVAGHGRSGLMAQALAMRLMHIGLQVYVVGEATTPAISSGDLFVAVTGSGTTDTTRSQLRKAASHGARTALVTTAAPGPADGALVIRVPVRGDGVATTQHAGSLFEQSSLVLFDAIARCLQDLLDLDDAELDARHANLA